MAVSFFFFFLFLKKVRQLINGVKSNSGIRPL